MAKSANLYARIEPDVKERAESILSELGIPVSGAINMFYKQIILQRGLPFDVKLPRHPSDIADMSEPQLDEELADVLIAISVIAKRLARKLQTANQEGGTPDGENERPGLTD